MYCNKQSHTDIEIGRKRDRQTIAHTHTHVCMHNRFTHTNVHTRSQINAFNIFYSFLYFFDFSFSVVVLMAFIIAHLLTHSFVRLLLWFFFPCGVVVLNQIHKFDWFIVLHFLQSQMIWKFICMMSATKR